MRYSQVNRGFPAGNPIANALVIIVGSLVIAASIVVGFFAFVILGSALLIMAAIIGIRLWWFKRKLARQGGPQTTAQRSGTAIEGEYVVIVEEREERGERPGD